VIDRAVSTGWRFCVNCGSKPERFSVCPHCGSDPFVLDADCDRRVRSVGQLQGDQVDDLLDTGKEGRAFIVSLASAIALGVVLTGVTFGLFLLVAVLGLSAYLVHKHHTRAHCMRIGENQMPLVHRLSMTAANRLNLPSIDVFVRQSPDFQAFTTGVGRQAWIVLHSSLIEALSPAELLYVIGHEMGHIKRRHVFWQTLVNPVGGPTVPLLAPLLQVVFSSWSRAAEFAADRAGLIASRDLEAACGALIKITVGLEAAKGLTHDAFLESFRGQHEAIAAASELMDSHPLMARRVEALLRFWKEFDGRAPWGANDCRADNRSGEQT
jgi:Zn-dependent protease with chaperone function